VQKQARCRRKTLYVRKYSGHAEVLTVTGDSSAFKLAIPLPSQGRQVFTLPSRSSLRSVFDVMRVDDDKITRIEILDLDGNRISRAIVTEDLLKSDFRLKINDVIYYVKSPARSLCQRTVVVSGNVTDTPQYLKVKEYFSSLAKDVTVLDLSAYLTKCLDLGIDNDQAMEILKTLTAIGHVLYIQEGIELPSKIFLRPGDIVASVQSAFHVETIRLTHEQRIALLNNLKSEIAPLTKIRDELLRKADRRSQIFVWTVFFALCGQFLLFARFTWWDFSWDVMEPVTYFTSVVEGAIAGYAYYLFTREEYTNMGFRDILTRMFFKRLASRNNFDNQHYENIQKKIAELENDIHYTAHETKFHSSHNDNL